MPFAAFCRNFPETAVILETGNPGIVGPRLALCACRFSGASVTAIGCVNPRPRPFASRATSCFSRASNSAPRRASAAQRPSFTQAE